MKDGQTQGDQLREYHLRETKDLLARAKVDDAHKLWGQLHDKLICDLKKAFPDAAAEELSESEARQLGMKAYLRPLPFGQ